MKHTVKITIILLMFFLVSQYLGLGLLYLTIDQIKTTESGKMEFKDLAFAKRPELEEQTSYIPIILTVLIGTGIVLLLIKFKLFKIWKLWFGFAIITTLSISLAVLLIPPVAITLAIIFGLWKILKPNIYIHNVTELLIYPAIALIFVPVLNLFSITMLLLLISIYDAYAVWKSKHMITLAESQTKAQLFAGLMIPYAKNTNAFKKIEPQQQPYSKNKDQITTTKSSQTKTLNATIPIHKSVTPEESKVAILGGGDIAFPLLFTGVILKTIGISYAFIVPIFTTLSLTLLFLKSKPGRYYPAMVFISFGCLVSYGVIRIIQYLL